MPMLELRNVGKAYRRYPSARARLLEAVAPWLGKRHEKVWVLRNVNLAV
jgi:lipopolysaccharide transport system ATP-binding protein